SSHDPPLSHTHPNNFLHKMYITKQPYTCLFPFFFLKTFNTIYNYVIGHVQHSHANVARDHDGIFHCRQGCPLTPTSVGTQVSSNMLTIQYMYLIPLLYMPKVQY